MASGQMRIRKPAEMTVRSLGVLRDSQGRRLHGVYAMEDAMGRGGS